MDFRLEFYFVLLLLLCLIQAGESQEAGKSVCGEEVCGNVTVPFPFGIETGCYSSSWFRVTCKETLKGKKPFISRLDLELLGSFRSDSIFINYPVTHVNCNPKSSDGSASINLTGSPFFFPSETSKFGSVGCGNYVSIFRNQTDSLGGCMQPICGDGASGSGCFGQISENLTSYTTKTTAISPASKEDSKRCASVFLFDEMYYSLDYPLPSDINLETTYVVARLAWANVSCDLKECQTPLISNREEKCGNVDIKYPFGINNGSYMNDWFRVTCRKTANGSVPLIDRFNLQLLEVSFFEGTVMVNHSVTSFNCRKNDNNGISTNLAGSPFYFSNMKSVFWSAGCGNLATIFGNPTDHFIGGCLQPSCTNNNDTSNAAGCLMTIPPFLNSFSANMTKIDPRSSSKSSCGSTFVVDSEFLASELKSDHQKISNWAQVPTTLQWSIPKRGLCELKVGVNTSCSSDGQYCWYGLSSSHLCVCSTDNTGSYTTDICQGRKCENSRYKYCQMLCLNTPDNYCSSQCPPEYEYISAENRCEPKKFSSSVLKEKTLNLMIIIGSSASIGTMFLLLVAQRIYKVLRRRYNVKRRQNYFKRIGGLLVQQYFSSNEGNVEKIKLFTSKELEKATDFFNENRILGQGGQGTVYKGMLTDGSIVAVKKSKMVEETKIDENKVEQFINEVIILSQIDHRNVVKLLGCCLDAEVPLLVYEFISNGTLSQLIHYQNEEFPLTWEMRLRIAIEIANALSYLHSAASVPIYHRDIKSSNILLDNKYRAKVSDFGTSRSIALEQTHLTTRVQGTFGYMDPEYFRSSQFTEKSDVYSFGVVLVEILTGQKPISSKQSQEVRSLVPLFLVSLQENSLFDILDPMVVNVGPEEEIIAVAKLAKRCLNLNGKRRPTMKQVAMELELIRASKEANAIQESGDEESDIDDINEPWLIPSCSTSRSTLPGSVTLPLNASF